MRQQMLTPRASRCIVNDMNDLPDSVDDMSTIERGLSPSVHRHLAALGKSLKTAGRDALTPQAVDSLALKVAREARRFSQEDKVQFITALYEHHNVHRACLATGISRRGALKVRARDPLFADAWHEALQSHVDDIEAHVMDMAKSSKAPLWAIFALKAQRPDIYGDRIKVDSTVETEVTVVLGGLAQGQDAVGSPSTYDSVDEDEGIRPRAALIPGSTAPGSNGDAVDVPRPSATPHTHSDKKEWSTVVDTVCEEENV